MMRPTVVRSQGSRRCNFGELVQLHDAVLVGELGLLRGPERMRLALQLGGVQLGDVLVRIGQVVEAQHHVLGRRRQRRAVGGARVDVVE